MPRPVAESEGDRKFLDVIDRHGWHIMQVYGEDDPSFCYSTGIFERTRQPELIIIGLPHELAGWLINEYGNRILAGETFEAGGLYDAFLDPFRITFIPVTDPRGISDYATWTDWFYLRQPFPLWQLVWPDSETGAFPWQHGYRESWQRLQPLLGAPPRLNS